MNILKFLLSIALTTGINIVVVPVVLHIAGATAWGGIAVAQSLASLASVFVAFGWGATGPTAVAQREGAVRGAYFRESIPPRVYLALVATPITLLLTLLAAPGDTAANLVAALAVLTGALAAPWFFVGERAPWRLLLLDTVPRAVAIVTGAVVLAVTDELVWFPAIQLTGSAVAVGLTIRSVAARYPSTGGTWSARSAVAVLTRQRHGITAAGAAALYVNLPVVLVGVIVPASTAIYVMGDKLQKITIVAFTPLLQVAQGHLGAQGAELVRRVRRLTGLAALAGVVIGLGFAGLSPLATRILSVGEITLPWSVAIALGTAVAGICVSAIVGLACLAVLNRMPVVARSTLVGAAVGLPLMVVLGKLGGAAGVAWAVAASELLVVAIQLVSLRSALRLVA